MNIQTNPSTYEPPICARCEEVGTSFVVEVKEQGDGMWLCPRHLARLQGHAATVPELDGMFDGALVVTEITSADLSDVDDGQGGRL